ncbi:MAG: glycosyltransferase family 2 protein [Phascolarctobacterium sp.]|nr:glycosyltransferase family 2 protein [Candidatus Phascolarctobacterium equi]
MGNEIDNKPKVSVLTPIYNTNPQYLRECIESILNQTFSDFEFLILNDSPDNLALDNFVASYKDGRIKYWKNDKNLGISPSRNKLLEMAKGEYIAIFDHDDISLPDRLQKEVQYLDQHPEVGVVSGLGERFGTQNGIIQQPENSLEIKLHLTDDCFVLHSAAMIRKSVLIQNNIRYESDYTPAEDYRLWDKLMDVTDFYNIQQILVRYRCFDAQTSIKAIKRIKQVHDLIAMDIRKKYPEYWQWYCLHSGKTVWRLRLFGYVPFLKMKNGWIYLFECIPLFRWVPS